MATIKRQKAEIAPVKRPVSPVIEPIKSGLKIAERISAKKVIQRAQITFPENTKWFLRLIINAPNITAIIASIRNCMGAFLSNALGKIPTGISATVNKRFRTPVATTNRFAAKVLETLEIIGRLSAFVF